MSESWMYTLNNNTGCGSSEDSSKRTCALKRMTLLIDSRDRDYSRHRTSSDFVIKLPSTLYNVTSATLKSAEIPTSYYVFGASRGNTSLLVTVDGVTETVTIPDGNYDFLSLANALTASLNTAFPGKTFVVTFSSATNRCTISVSPSSTIAVDVTAVDPVLKPTQSCLAWYLGFSVGLVTNGTGSVTGSKVANPNPELYMLIDIAELNKVHQSALYGSGGSQGSVFAKVPIANQSFSVICFDKLLSCCEYVPSIAALTELRVSFRWHDGTLIDFGGVENSLTLELTCTQTR